MADEKNLEQSKIAFNTLCKALEHNDWSYDKDEKELKIECKARGDDLPMDIRICIYPDNMVIALYSNMPFVIQEDKRLETAIAVSAVNNNLVDGSFDFNIANGNLLFRLTSSFRESTVSEEVFSYMLHCSCITIDEYNDKFLMLSKGIVSIEKFISDFTK